MTSVLCLASVLVIILRQVAPVTPVSMVAMVILPVMLPVRCVCVLARSTYHCVWAPGTGHRLTCGILCRVVRVTILEHCHVTTLMVLAGMYSYMSKCHLDLFLSFILLFSPSLSLSCHDNIVGANCSECEADYYGFSMTGCVSCDCSEGGSNDTQCDNNGICTCKVHSNA